MGQMSYKCPPEIELEIELKLEIKKEISALGTT